MAISHLNISTSPISSESYDRITTAAANYSVYKAESHTLGTSASILPGDCLSIKRARCVALEMSLDVDRLGERTYEGNTQNCRPSRTVGPFVYR
jgi:hypothetical protein